MIRIDKKQNLEDTDCKSGTIITAAPFDPTDETVFAISSPLYNHNWEDKQV